MEMRTKFEKNYRKNVLELTEFRVLVKIEPGKNCRATVQFNKTETSGNTQIPKEQQFVAASRRGGVGNEDPGQ